MKSKGYTLWLVPKGVIYKKFSGLIKNLAKKYDGPIFEPHVTLIGDLAVGDLIGSEKRLIALTQQLASAQKPFSVTLKQIDYENYYFRTLIVKALKTKPLLSLQEKAKKIFGVENASPYMPHLSLLYGLYPVKIKEQIISEIGRNQNSKFIVSSLVLLKGGKVEDWKMIGEFKFS